ncbi:MAG: hypothetical protein EAZ42_05060 [Verrucomicrobia bacterium]|nr:MAG: hypothetical protein EAZ42_05060 [Verrucomicrobiota bacterium]
MSWIKENKFVAGLIGVTLVCIAGLYFFGSSAAGRYEEELSKFQAAADEARSFESLPLYPKTENVHGKTKALAEYRAAVESIQAAYGKYVPKEITNTSPQDFTNRLKDVDAGLVKAFEESSTALPEGFFSGFESFRTSLPAAPVTGLLNYQLNASQFVLQELAKARPVRLVNFYREPLAEEIGQTFTPGPDDAARKHSFELSFVGSERSVREFIGAISNPSPHYVVIRSMRVINMKKEAPKASDAKFEKEAKASTGSPAAAPAEEQSVFGSLPGDEAAASEPAAAAPQPAAPSVRILAPVLGSEDIRVFLRYDVLQFLPAKPLP